MYSIKSKYSYVNAEIKVIEYKEGQDMYIPSDIQLTIPIKNIGKIPKEELISLHDFYCNALEEADSKGFSCIAFETKPVESKEKENKSANVLIYDLFAYLKTKEEKTNLRYIYIIPCDKKSYKVYSKILYGMKLNFDTPAARRLNEQ